MPWELGSGWETVALVFFLADPLSFFPCSAFLPIIQAIKQTKAPNNDGNAFFGLEREIRIAAGNYLHVPSTNCLP